MELLEKLPDVTVKGDAAQLVEHVSLGSAKQIMTERQQATGCGIHLPESDAIPRAFRPIRQSPVPAVM